MTNQVEFDKEVLTIEGDNFDFSTLSRYTKLKELDCRHSELLTCLPVLPATLKKLMIMNCPLLTCLPELPTTLTKLWCHICPLLTALPELPDTLTDLRCYECPLITALPELPATLTKLWCSQQYFIDKYDYHIESSIEKYRNDPKTIERRKTIECRDRNGIL